MDSPDEKMVEEGVLGPKSDAPFQLRSYQAEMVEESLKNNIIVVMDTGSGKTHIAIERTRAELEMCEPEKLVWFLAPTVTLCEQQYEVFKSNLPGYGIQLLSGKDGVDHWTEQSVWDAVLHNVRITVSTHQVLLDALTHGFVKMSRLALLIFDEAHHCTQNHPAHHIMFFYGRELDSTPKILGLSASPVMRASATEQALQQIERNLQAITKTPKLHRSDLVRYVHIPELIQIAYWVEPEAYRVSSLFFALNEAYNTYDINTDPYIVDLLNQQRDGFNVSRQLQKAFLSRKTYCLEQLKMLVSKATNMAEELGNSVMEWYIRQCIARFEVMVRTSDEELVNWTVNEKQHLLGVLQPFSASTANNRVLSILESISSKVELLIETLASEYEQSSGFTGLVFVEQRVWVAALGEILTNHPRTKDLFQVGTYVGASQSGKRKANIGNLVEPDNQQTTLNDFRAGKTNLIITTSVLEEGIDVSNCHLVICFERPKTLKSFVQRRGRARKQESKYFIFTPNNEIVRSSESWQALEEEMRNAYENDKRIVEEAERREAVNEFGERYLEIPSTGAVLTLDNALAHLNHFCASLGSGAYVSGLAQFEFFEEKSTGCITAKVTLPMSIDPALRSASSLESWVTERSARKDAAFEAFKNLHAAGLVNDNLLPWQYEANEQALKSHLPDYRPSMVQVLPTYDPWQQITRHQHANPNVWYRTLLKVSTAKGDIIRMILLTPLLLPEIPELLLYWNETQRCSVKSSWLPGAALSDQEIESLRLISGRILGSAFHLKGCENDFLCLLAPCDITSPSGWFSSIEGEQSASGFMTETGNSPKNWGIVTHQGRKYLIEKTVFAHNQSVVAAEDLRLLAVRFPKRRDFLHPIPENAHRNDAYTRIEEIPASECTVSNLPAHYSIFAALFPSIMHKFEVHMTAEALMTTLLKPVAFESSDLPAIISAITASATGEKINYEKLEFLGDTILKFIASVHLMAQNLRWPEGYLSATKGRIVSNAFLSRACLAAGLDQYILTKHFTGAKWKPRRMNRMSTENDVTGVEEKSSKVVADVIESLIGASYVTGGLPKAFACMEVLLPLEKWIPVPEATQILHEAVPDEFGIKSPQIVEKLIGRTFQKKALLLEALTHASYSGPYAHGSYQRLEFLGDAVLDYIITKRIFQRDFSQDKMHLIRSASVNAFILAYCMTELTVQEEMTNKVTKESEVHQRALWQFLRSGSHQLIVERDRALKEHAKVKEQIATSLQRDASFPWHLLALIDAPKFLSDIVESVIGAIYVDSCGNISACESFISRLGIFGYADRIMDDNVDVRHPKLRLGILAVDKDVNYVRVGHDRDEDRRTSKLYRCQIMVAGEKVGGVVEGLKRSATETIAAWRAVAILDRDRYATMEEDSEDEDVFFDAEGGVELAMDERS